jgi:hypothetical protein
LPLATDVIHPGHWLWIAMLARKPAMGGARPPWPLISVALLAKLPPGLTSMGQMDCPI